MINEVAQWTVLVFLSVFVLGLTRQLGRFLVNPREERSQQGPDIGARVPRALLPDDSRETLIRLMAERPAQWAALVFVRDRCSGCNQLVRNLAEFDVPDNAPVAVHTNAVGDNLAKMAAVADVVIADPGGERAKAAEISAMPFIVLLDEELRVVYKRLGVRIDHLYLDWQHAHTHGRGANGRTAGRVQVDAHGEGA